MEHDDYKRIADFYREIMIFFGALFFTCFVGIIELLPQLEEIHRELSWNWLLLSIIYFGLLGGINYSVREFFWLYSENKTVREKFGHGFYFPDIERLVKYFKKVGNLELFLSGTLTVVFFLLYLVKIGLLH